MKCPHCNYVDGWNSEKSEDVKGEEGVFYQLPIRLQRSILCHRDDEKNVYGCPACKKVFLDNTW